MSKVKNPDPTETGFQGQVVELAHLLGWHAMHVRPTIGTGQQWTTSTSITGWPDLFCWHPRRERFFAAELKSEHGRLTPEQATCLATLRAAGVPVYVWRPSDWPEIEALLSRPERHLAEPPRPA